MSPSDARELFNPDYRQGSHSFGLFPSLPTELRFKIWDTFLRRERFITINILRQPVQSKHFAPLGRSVSDRKYKVNIEWYQAYNPLFDVNRESRQAALSYYRARVPCVFDKQGIYTTVPNGILFFNPEMDILCVRTIASVASFVDLFLDFQAYDPRRVGITKIALEYTILQRLNSHGAPELGDASRTAFLKSISSLQKVIFVIEEPLGNWRVFRLFSTNEPTRCSLDVSRPIMTSLPAFERYQLDPRPVQQALRQVYLGSRDPRRMLCHWTELVSKWGAQHGKMTEHRLLVASLSSEVLSKHPDDVVDRESARGWLLDEEKALVREQQALRNEPGNASERMSAEGVTGQDSIQPVVGFWLFPIEVIGGLPPRKPEYKDMDQPLQVENLLWDLSEYWPELYAADL